MTELAGKSGRDKVVSRVIRFSKVGLYEGIEGRGFLYSGIGTSLRPYDEGFSVE